eukprot:gene28684-35585_t
MPSLPLAARTAHIFPGLIGSLLSIGILCDNGLTATYSKRKVIIRRGRTVVLSGDRSQTSRLWMIDLNKQKSAPNGGSQPATPASGRLLSFSPPRSQEQTVALYHACFNWPSVPTFLAAVEKQFISLPGLTAAMVRKYPPNPTATAKGHLEQLRQGMHSTKSTPETEESDEDWHPVNFTRSPVHVTQRRSAKIWCKTVPVHAPRGLHYSDLAGRFPVTSLHGMEYHLIQYCEDANYIHVELLRSRKGPEYTRAYQAGTEFFMKHGIRPEFERLDNETSPELKAYCESLTPPIVIQYVAPGMHRANKAERCIRTWKNHFLSTLAGTDPSFPLYAWDELVPQAELTLNMMRSSGITPHMSAWQQLHGAFNFDSTPLAPPGMKVVVHEKPDKRPSWGYHGVDGFYVGPALGGSYRCFTVFISETRKTRITDTLSWHPPSGSQLIGTRSTDDLVSLLAQIVTALTSLATSSTLHADQQQSLHAALPSVTLAFRQLSSVFNPSALVDDGAPAADIERVIRSEPISPPPGLTMPPETAPPANMILPPSAPIVVTPVENNTSAEEQRVSPIAEAPPVVTTDKWYRVARRHHKKKQQQIAPPSSAPTSQSPPINFPTATADPKEPRTAKRRNRQPATIAPATHPQIPQRVARTASLFGRPRRQTTVPTRFRAAMAAMIKADNFAGAVTGTRDTVNYLALLTEHFAGSAISSSAVAPLTHAAAKRGPNRLRWERAESEEFERLIADYGGTIRFIKMRDKPKDRKASYYNPQVKVKMKNGVEEFRVRGTYGGDRGDFAGDVTAWVADMTTLKLLLNATISEGADFCCADIKDFYLGTPLERKEYMKIQLTQIPKDIQEKYDIAKLAVDGAVMVEVRKGIYGLKQAGKLAQDRLIKHLAAHGYHQTPNTPCLFKHETRPVFFTLVVDDFAIKYKGQDNLDHLFGVLRSLYTITVDPTGSKYIGIKIVFDRIAKTVELSMPNYIQKALERFGITPAQKSTDAPSPYTQPVYGKGTQQLATVDNSAPLSAADTKFVQEVVGVIAYYARAVDATMLTAVNKIGSRQARPTQAVLGAVSHLLQYAASWPDATIVYHASGMQLALHSDASYLSETHSRSRAGGIHFLTDLDKLNDPSAINGAIDCISTIIPSVVASAFEAEYAAMYINATTAEGIRTTLCDLGYPQGATPLVSDNQCAVGVANRSVKQRRSKAIDMRYHWIRDRVSQKHFNVSWRPGKTNLADFFTKSHPASHHREMRSLYVKP